MVRQCSSFLIPFSSFSLAVIDIILIIQLFAVNATIVLEDCGSTARDVSITISNCDTTSSSSVTHCPFVRGTNATLTADFTVPRDGIPAVVWTTAGFLAPKVRVPFPIDPEDGACSNYWGGGSNVTCPLGAGGTRYRLTIELPILKIYPAIKLKVQAIVFANDTLTGEGGEGVSTASSSTRGGGRRTSPSPSSPSTGTGTANAARDLINDSRETLVCLVFPAEIKGGSNSTRGGGNRRNRPSTSSTG